MVHLYGTLMVVRLLFLLIVKEVWMYMWYHVKVVFRAVSLLIQAKNIHYSLPWMATCYFQQTSCHQLKRLSFLQVLSGKYIKYP